MKFGIHPFVQYTDDFDCVILPRSMHDNMTWIVNSFISIGDTVAAESKMIRSRGGFQSLDRVTADSMRIICDVSQTLEN